MFCYKCGFQIPDDAQFCSKCGTEQKANAATVETKKNGEYSNEALKIYFTDLLTLECVKNKLQNDLLKLKNDVELKEVNNYSQSFFVNTVDYGLYGNRGAQHYLHFLYDGEEVKFAAYKNSNGNFGHTTPIKNGYCVDTRQTLNYDGRYGYAVTEWLSVEKEKEIFETVWQYEDNGLFFGFVIKNNNNIKDYCLTLYSDFKKTAPYMYKQNLIEIEKLKNDLNNITMEFDKASELLEKAYAVNIVPQQFRNLYAVYYLSDFINTSNESLSTALLNYNLEIIKEKLDEIIEQQQEIIINQALMMAQNDKIMKQNEQQLRHLASIEQNTDRAAQYAQIASNNAEACAWIGIANYISK